MKILREISLTFDRPLSSAGSKVELMSRVVCALLIQALGRRIKTPNFWKISVRVNARDDSENGSVLLGVLIVNKSFPVEQFLDWPLGSRQDYMLKFIAGVLHEVFRQFEINPCCLGEAVQYVVAKEFRNYIVGRRVFRGPEDGLSARIECEQEMDEARVYARFQRGSSALGQRAFVIRTDPEEFVIQKFFGAIEWLDGAKPVLRLVDGSMLSICQVPDDHGQMPGSGLSS
jgi:hypothetical protein